MPTLTPPELELLAAIATTTRERMAAAACSVALVDDDGLVFVAADGVGAQEVVGLRLPLGRGIAGWVTVSGQSIAIADVHADKRFDAETAAKTGYVPTSILAVPVEDDEGPVGVLEVLDRTPGVHDLEVAAAAARQVAVVRSMGERLAGLDTQLADPALAGLLDLVRRLAARPADVALAERLLAAVLAQD